VRGRGAREARAAMVERIAVALAAAAGDLSAF
jgi:hypothetical protein